MHKIAVVGRGLIGSAAARHLAESADGILCIGPDEPESHDDHDGVFASHYDEGRMTRNVDPDPEWSITAVESISRYRDLEKRSGISFYSPVGYLGLGHPGSTYNARCAATGEANNAEIERLDTAGIRSRYPFLSVADDADGLVEAGGAGHISPRNIVKAQTILAEQSGATIVRAAARSIRALPSGVEIELWNGSVETAEKVLVTAGAFTEACNLCPTDLGLTVFGRTVVLARIEGAATAALANMPTMIDAVSGAYILPPIRYRDGHSYLKMGVGEVTDPRFDTLDGLQHWFKGQGSDKDRTSFVKRLKELFPVLQQCSVWQTDTCAVTWTSSGYPIIDYVLDDRIAVAVGGCGKGAKGSDEWGRIAAGLVQNAPWSSQVPRQKLALRSKQS